MTTRQTRLQRALDQARHALASPPEARQPGLGDPEFSISTRRTALAPGLSPTLVHPHGRRGLSALVDPFTLQTLEHLLTAGRELQRGGVGALLEHVRADGARRRARMLEED